MAILQIVAFFLKKIAKIFAGLEKVLYICNRNQNQKKMNNTNNNIYFLQRERTETRNEKLVDCYETIEPYYYESTQEAKQGIEERQRELIKRANTDIWCADNNSLTFPHGIQYRWRIVTLYHA